jgi:hypothetical protein
MSLNFDVDSNLSQKVSHYEKNLKMCQFYSDSSRFFFATNCTEKFILASYLVLGILLRL